MRTRMIIVVVVSCVLGTLSAGAGLVSVTNVTAAQRAGAPFVDIAYDLLNASGGLHSVLAEVSTNGGASYNVCAANFSGAVGPDVSTGMHKEVVWFAAGDLPDVTGITARVRVTAMEGTGWYYCIVDVSGGPDAANYPVSYQSFAPPLDDEHKTSKIVLRRIPAGSFVMGSPAGELGRDGDETQHTVTFTNDCYVGIYEITQAQYTNVMGGSNPAAYTANTRPVEKVSWNTVRGGTWPGGAPTNTSFMGKLRAKTGLNFDLPTEARWEYACRAGTTSAWNNGTQITNTTSDGNLNLLGRYANNGGSSSYHAPVGSYLPNAWGLYDMHGNVYEWCLDRFGTYGGDATDPAGPGSGTERVMRGGCWAVYAGYCRSADRGSRGPYDSYNFLGFRLSLPAGP